MRRRTLRSLILAASVAVRHVRGDPVRAIGLALRVAPGPLRGPAARSLARLPERDPHRERGTRAAGYGPAAVTVAAPQPQPHRHTSARAVKPVPGRVLHVVTNSLPYKNAGYTVRTHAIARAQRAAGLDPQVVTRIGFPVAQGVWDGRPVHHVDGVPYHRLLPGLMPAAPAALLARNAELAARLVERIRPAVLHAATDHPNGRVALTLGRSFGLPVVYEVRGFLEETWLTQGPGRSADSASYRERRALETYCMREADLVFTLGEAMKQEIAGRGIPEEKVLVVPNAVDDVFLEPLPPAGHLRARLGIAPNELVVGTVSTLAPHEGLGTLLEAVAELRRRGVPLRLLIVGDGPLRPALQRQAAGLGLAETALFTGRVPHAQVRAHHALLDVFAVPRTGERVCHLVTPLKPVEAMASGLPIAASDVKAMGELVEDEVNGKLIPPEDPHSWADTLEILLYSPNQRRIMGDAARTRVARDRTWAHIAERTRDAYRHLGAV